MNGLYDYITEKRDDSPSLKNTMENAAERLIKSETSVEHPGILLGMIQSGKTRAFIGILAKCFDEEYDVSIVLTKSSKALVEQTVRRIKDEFKEPYQHDYLDVYDIMSLPQELTPFILEKKLILVVKKEKHNLRKLHELFFEEYPTLADKKVLIIDDEADFASVTYSSDKTLPDGIRFGTLATMISEFRNRLKSDSDFLQVTATPYSLYLQPEELNINDGNFAPLRPRFTEILKPHDSYTGGSYYFEESLNNDSPASNLFVSVPQREFSRLKSPYQRYLDTVHETSNLKIYRFGFINFLVGGSIRLIQEQGKSSGNFPWRKVYKCAYLIHTEHTTKAHSWQVKLTKTLIDRLKDLIRFEEDKFTELVKDSYSNMSNSVLKAGFDIPELNDVLTRVKKAVNGGEIGVREVNSNEEVINQLDDNGQLRLDNPFNVFIGGQVLDRGITIDNLIGFFYGRNPSSFQMDTVLQHSRMYGARDPKDLAVTRMYTSPRIFNAMQSMYQFDKALRDSIEESGAEASIRFIERKSGGGIRPCSPSKIRISSLQTLKSYSRHLPYGFQTVAKTYLKQITEKIDDIVSELPQVEDNIYATDAATVHKIVDLINQSFEYKDHWDNEGWEWNTDAFHQLLDYVSNDENGNKVYILHRTGRKIKRLKGNETTFSDAPEDGRTDTMPAKRLAQEDPALLLLKQQGLEEDGWRGHPFYWPVLIAPRNTRTSIYTEN